MLLPGYLADFLRVSMRYKHRRYLQTSHFQRWFIYAYKLKFSCFSLIIFVPLTLPLVLLREPIILPQRMSKFHCDMLTTKTPSLLPFLKIMALLSVRFLRTTLSLRRSVLIRLGKEPINCTTWTEADFKIAPSTVPESFTKPWSTSTIRRRRGRLGQNIFESCELVLASLKTILNNFEHYPKELKGV